MKDNKRFDVELLQFMKQVLPLMTFVFHFLFIYVFINLLIYLFIYLFWRFVSYFRSVNFHFGFLVFASIL